MNQQINNNNQVSIYIPRMSINITESVVMEIFRTSNIGEVNRVDFTQINKKTGFIENNHNNMKSAFVHFKNYYNNDSTNKIIEGLQNGQSIKFYLDDFRCGVKNRQYWLLLKAKTVVPETMMNNHQIVENCRFLEKKVEEQEITIHNLSDQLDCVVSVVNQLLGGLFCHKNQRKTLENHTNILFNEKINEDLDEDKSKWGGYPTTRQGDDNERRIEELKRLLFVFIEGSRISKNDEEEERQIGIMQNIDKHYLSEI